MRVTSRAPLFHIHYLDEHYFRWLHTHFLPYITYHSAPTHTRLIPSTTHPPPAQWQTAAAEATEAAGEAADAEAITKPIHTAEITPLTLHKTATEAKTIRTTAENAANVHVMTATTETAAESESEETVIEPMTAIGYTSRREEAHASTATMQA
jgi:hypothetical protein